MGGGWGRRGGGSDTPKVHSFLPLVVNSGRREEETSDAATFTCLLTPGSIKKTRRAGVVTSS